MASNIAISLFLIITFVVATADCNFIQDFDIYWGDGRTKVLNNGELLTLSLDKTSAFGIHTKNEYLFGKFDIQIKLVPGNSAGTVTAFYLTSANEPTHDEVDFEFLGNLSGEPYIVHTNVYTQNEGHREQQFYLWFDPTEHFHTDSLTWSNLSLIFYVDGTPIRQFKNLESFGVPFPENQTMGVHCSIWDGDEWVTRGGLVKTDWSQAPFTATFKNYNAQACVWNSDSASSSCSSNNNHTWLTQKLDASEEAKIQWVQKNYMIYNYCNDTRVIQQGLPPS